MPVLVPVIRTTGMVISPVLVGPALRVAEEPAC
jgi:hypothetical protein